MSIQIYQMLRKSRFYPHEICLEVFWAAGVWAGLFLAWSAPFSVSHGYPRHPSVSNTWCGVCGLVSVRDLSWEYPLLLFLKSVSWSLSYSVSMFSLSFWWSPSFSVGGACALGEALKAGWWGGRLFRNSYSFQVLCTSSWDSELALWAPTSPMFLLPAPSQCVSSTVFG